MHQYTASAQQDQGGDDLVKEIFRKRTSKCLELLVDFPPLESKLMRINKLMSTVGLLALVLGTGAKAAPAFACYENERTQATQCIDVKNIKEADGIRTAALYSGGPREIKKTSYTIAVNCRTNVAHLKDRQGVSFAGGYGGNGRQTEAITTLMNSMCINEPVGAKKSKGKSK
jgi:hypothetical protein